MTQLIQVTSRQYSFDPLMFEEEQKLTREEARKAALAARAALRKAIERDHPGRYNIKCWTLTGQLRKYKCWGVPCGRVRNVFYMNVLEAE
jgi:hypothetical protein